MYSYNPVHWFELQGGVGLDHTETYGGYGSSNANYSRIRPALDARIAFLLGGRGPGVRAAFDIGLAGHITSDGDASVMWTFGFKLH